LANAPQFATAGGDITLTTGAGGTMALASTGTDAVSSSGGNITLLADNLAIGSGVNAGTGTVTIAPVTTARPIDVGTSTGAGHLVVDATALSADLTADTLVIGANNAGSLTVNGALGPTNVSNLLKLDSGSNINLAATIDMAGRTLQLIAGAGISETPPVIASTLSITAVGPVSMLDANQIGTLAANVTGAGNSFAFRNDNLALTIGTVGATTGVTTSNADITMATTTNGSLSLTQAIAAGTGTVRLSSAGAVSQNSSGTITAGALGVIAAGGPVTLDQANAVGTLAGSVGFAASDFRFNNTGTSLTVGTVTASGPFAGATGVTTNDGLIRLTTTTSGDLTLTQAVSAVNSGVALTAAGTISESGSGLVSTSASLITTSAGGTTLGGANAIASFNATNTTGGAISLTNTAAPLTVTGIIQTGGGGITINNTGALTLTGGVSADGGTISLTASGIISEVGGTLSTTGTLFTSSAGGTTLGGANTVGTFSASNNTSGAISLTNTASPLTVTGITQSGGGNVAISNTDP